MFAKAKRENGSVFFEGKEYALKEQPVETAELLQAPYINYSVGVETYDFKMKADAVDENGEAHEVTWLFLNEQRGANETYDHLDFEKVWGVVKKS